MLTSSIPRPCKALTLYAWDISHTLATLYHPNAHEPAALTEYLKRKLQVQRAKCRSRSHPAHIEQNVPLEHNNFTVILLNYMLLIILV